MLLIAINPFTGPYLSGDRYGGRALKLLEMSLHLGLLTERSRALHLQSIEALLAGHRRTEARRRQKSEMLFIKSKPDAKNA